MALTLGMVSRSYHLSSLELANETYNHGQLLKVDLRSGVLAPLDPIVPVGTEGLPTNL